MINVHCCSGQFVIENERQIEFLATGLCSMPHPGLLSSFPRDTFPLPIVFLWGCFLRNPSHKNPCLGIRFIFYKKVKSLHKIILIQDSQSTFSSTAKESFLIWFYSFSITAILTSFLHPLDYFNTPSLAHGPQEGKQMM